MATGIVNDTRFRHFFSVVITLNMIAFASDQYDASKIWQDFAFYTYIVCIVLFWMEILVRLVAAGNLENFLQTRLHKVRSVSVVVWGEVRERRTKCAFLHECTNDFARKSFSDWSHETRRKLSVRKQMFTSLAVTHCSQPTSFCELAQENHKSAGPWHLAVQDTWHYPSVFCATSCPTSQMLPIIPLRYSLLYTK